MDFHNGHSLRENVPIKKWQDVVEGSEICKSLMEEGVGIICRSIFSDGKQKVLISDATELCFTPAHVSSCNIQGSIHFRN